MIKIIKILQLDSSEASIVIDTTTEKAEIALLQDGYEFNKITGYWEKENEMILLQQG